MNDAFGRVVKFLFLQKLSWFIYEWGIDLSKLPERYRLLKPYVQGKTVLHLGCIGHSWRRSLEHNWIHRFIVEQAKNALGLDILEEDAKKLIQLGYDIKYGDAENFDLGRQFDVVFAGELIEHLANFHGFLECCKKHMRGDSKLIVTTPNCFGIRYYLGYLLNRSHTNLEHTCLFDEVTLTHLLVRHGFQIEIAKIISLDREFMQGSKKAVVKLIEKIIPKARPVLFFVTRKKNLTGSTNVC